MSDPEFAATSSRELHDKKKCQDLLIYSLVDLVAGALDILQEISFLLFVNSSAISGRIAARHGGQRQRPL